MLVRSFVEQSPHFRAAPFRGVTGIGRAIVDEIVAQRVPRPRLPTPEALRCQSYAAATRAALRTEIVFFRD
jgi:hypothetical protein